LSQLARDGVISPGEGFQATRSLPSHPSQLRQYLIQQNLQVMTAAERLKASLPQVELRDTGKAITPIDVNPLTNPVPQPLPKTTTPGEDLQAGTTRRGQDMTDTRERALAANSVTYQQRDDGSFVALPNRPAPGVVRAQQVVTPEGMQPLRGKPSESQAKALMEVNRMRAVISGGLQAAINNPTAFSYGRGLANVVPTGESLAGRLETDAETQARSYVFNNVSAVINERAGAAQSAQELARLRGFLPADTDNAKQVENKMRGFLQYLDDIEAGTRMPRSVNPGATPPAAPGSAPPAAPTRPGAPAPINFEIPNDVDAILRGVGLVPGAK